MKNILLINPPYTSYFDSKHFSVSRPSKNNATTSIPHGLAHLAGYLLAMQIKVKCLDLEVTPKSLKEIAELIKLENYEIVGFTSTTPLIGTTIKIAKYIKKNTHALLALGGIHASAEPLETNAIGVFDVIIVGEGELPLADLCLGIPPKKIPGAVYNNKVNTRYELIKDLDDLPSPAYNLFPAHLYKASIHRDLEPNFQQPYHTIITGRGCPYTCKFCYSKGIFFNKTRVKSVQTIFTELSSFEKSFPNQPLKVMIYDDTFTFYRSRILDFCSEIKKRNLNIIWGCNTRVDHIDNELLKTMKQAGCKCIYIGVENGNDEFLVKINKSLSKTKIKQGVELIKNNQIDTSASYIIGVPGETRQSIYNTMKFAAELNTGFAHFYTFTPDPGSPFYQELKAQGLIKPFDWLDYNKLIEKAALALGEKISYNELIKLTKEAYQFYYTQKNWRNMWENKIKSAAQRKRYKLLVEQYTLG